MGFNNVVPGHMLNDPEFVKALAEAYGRGDTGVAVVVDGEQSPDITLTIEVDEDGSGSWTRCLWKISDAELGEIESLLGRSPDQQDI